MLLGGHLPLRKMAAEFIGTFFIVLFGCGAIAGHSAQVPLIFGLGVMVMIYAVGHISGAHFNPAVTLGFSAVKRFPRSQLLAYWVAQFAGALLAVTLLGAVLPPGVSLGELSGSLGPVATTAVEAVLTFFLMFVILSVAHDSRAVGTMAGVAIGAAVSLGAAVGGPLTGAGMNPARWLGPAVWSGNFTAALAYVIGPALGAVAGAKAYEWLRCEAKQAGPERREGAAK